MLRFLFRKRVQNDIESATDFGRRFGWLVLYHGRCVAELDYIRWEEDMQFWHRYKIRWLEPCDIVSSLPYEKWQEHGLTIRSKKFPQVEFRDYMAAGTGKGDVLLRAVYVSRDVLAGK